MMQREKLKFKNGEAKQIDAVIQKHRSFKQWQKLVCVLAVLTLFLSGISMRKPAATMEGQSFCGMEEHTHSSACSENGLPCELPEHQHSHACFSNPDADLESPSAWEHNLKQLSLTAHKSENLTAVAKSQIGYTESKKNYQVAEDGTDKGYTRYGAWYGSPYGDWNAMFVSFCLHYADISPLEMPYASDCRSWVDALSALGLYKPAAADAPKAGELVFTDRIGADKQADSVGILSEVLLDGAGVPCGIKVIEGDIENQVVETEYALPSSDILGYGLLPKERGSTAPPPVRPTERSFSAVGEDGQITVQAVVENGSGLPEHLSLLLQPISETDYGYREMVQAVLAEKNKGTASADAGKSLSADYPAQAIQLYAVRWLSDGTGFALPDAEKASLRLYIRTEETEGAEIFGLEALPTEQDSTAAVHYRAWSAEPDENGQSLKAAALFAVTPPIPTDVSFLGMIDGVSVEDSPAFMAWRDRFTSHDDVANFVLTLQNKSDKSRQLAYCYNHSKAYPTQYYQTWRDYNYPTYYRSLDVNNQTFVDLADGEKDGGVRLRERVMSVIWNGFPYDAAGLKEKYADDFAQAISFGYGIHPDNILYLATQYAVWWFTDHDDMTVGGELSQWNGIPYVIQRAANELVALADKPNAQAPKNFALDLYLTKDKSTGGSDGYVDPNGTVEHQRLLALRGQPVAYLSLKLNKTWKGTGTPGADSAADKAAHPPITFEIYKGTGSEKKLIDTVVFQSGEQEKTVNLLDEHTIYTIREVYTGTDVLEVHSTDIGNAGSYDRLTPQEYTIDLSKMDRESGKLVTKKQLEYINEAPGSVQLTKKVENASAEDSGTSFKFQVTVTDKNGQPYNGPLQYTGAAGTPEQPKLNNGSFTVQLCHNESGLLEWLPKGTKVTFTEEKANGWEAVDPVTVEIQSGIRAFATVTNTKDIAAYVLPETGGMGIYGYIGGGMVLIFVSLLSLYIIKRVHRKGEQA